MHKANPVHQEKEDKVARGKEGTSKGLREVDNRKSVVKDVFQTTQGPKPANRQINLIIEDNIQEEGTRSWIGITGLEQWGRYTTGENKPQDLIRGITQKKFIITLESKGDLNSKNKEMLEEWFTEIKVWDHRELVQPRLAWIHCQGLPLSAWNEGNLQAIVQQWGQIASAPTLPMICNLYQK